MNNLNDTHVGGVGDLTVQVVQYIECNLNTGLMKANPTKGTCWRPTPMPQGGVIGQAVDILGNGALAPKLCKKYSTIRGQPNCAFPGCRLYGKYFLCTVINNNNNIYFAFFLQYTNVSLPHVVRLLFLRKRGIL